MDFLSSPIHNYSYETLEDGFFELPKEMDFEMQSELKDGISSLTDDDDLNDGMYGVWNAKHPWTINNNSSSIYNSNLHLDFIGGDPESAMMVNPNIVIPSGFQFDEETISEKDDSEELDTRTSSPSRTESNESLIQNESVSVQAKKVRSQLMSLKENIVNIDRGRTSVPSKNGIHILKPMDLIGNNQAKIEAVSARVKTITSKSSGSAYYHEGHFYPKPTFSYSCLIALALKNSRNGCLPVAEIYNFMCNHFPYFKTAPTGWKNSVRHNLSLNKCFEKIDKPAGSTQRKGCLWALNPSKAAKLEEEVQKCTKKDVTAIKRAMEYPEHLELLERGELKSLYDSEQTEDDDDDDVDVNEEEDTELEDPIMCDEDLVDEGLSEDPLDCSKAEDDDRLQYPSLNISDSSEFPEFKIEVDDSIYEELIGSIKNEQLFAVSEAAVKNAKSVPSKKVKKTYFIEVNRDTIDKNSLLYQSGNKKNDTEIFDHYDINNLLRLENETKLSTSTSKKTSPQTRFNGNSRRVTTSCSNSRIKQIKFKTWN